MSVLKLIQNINNDTETLKVCNINETQKEVIINKLSDHFDFDKNYKKDQIIIIKDVKKDDIQLICDTIKSIY